MYYRRMVDVTILVALSAISAIQIETTEQTEKSVTQQLAAIPTHNVPQLQNQIFAKMELYYRCRVMHLI